MRRAWRIIVGALRGLMAALCVLVVVLWARSYAGRDVMERRWVWRDGEGIWGRSVAVVSREGRLRISVGWTVVAGKTDVGEWMLGGGAQRPRFLVRREKKQPWDFGEELPRDVKGWGPVHWSKYPGLGPWMEEWLNVYVDHWLAAVVLGVWPGWWGVRRGGKRWRRWRWGREGRCVGCGYDLRGTGGGRCSECGRENTTAGLE